MPGQINHTLSFLPSLTYLIRIFRAVVQVSYPWHVATCTALLSQSQRPHDCLIQQFLHHHLRTWSKSRGGNVSISTSILL